MLSASAVQLADQTARSPARRSAAAPRPRLQPVQVLRHHAAALQGCWPWKPPLLVDPCHLHLHSSQLPRHTETRFLLPLYALLLATFRLRSAELTHAARTSHPLAWRRPAAKRGFTATTDASLITRQLGLCCFLQKPCLGQAPRCRCRAGCKLQSAGQAHLISTQG